MEKIFVVGHKNPDTDSVCSAYAYAHLKNILDPGRNYIACRCGNVNRQTRFVFDRIGAPLPMYLSDVFLRVNDIMTKDVISVGLDDTIIDCMRNIEKMKIGITPVINEGRKLKGIVSYIEITEFFMSLATKKRPEYLIKPSNFEKAIDGYLLKKGDKDEFWASFVVGGMPYETFKKRVKETPPEKIVLIVGNRKNILKHAIENQFSAIILTGIENSQELELDLSKFKGWVFVSHFNTAETLNLLLLSMSVKNIMNTDVPVIKVGDEIDSAKHALSNVDLKGLPVVDDEGTLVGIVTRMNFIQNIKKKLIFVDHNEFAQAVDGAESAEILEIVDHHRLGTIKTIVPIYVYTKPVGSTCTLVYQLYKSKNVDIDKKIAGILLSGILSDTVVLKSPTATIEDVEAAKELSEIAGLNYQSFGAEIFAAIESLKSLNPKEAITTDLKIYNEYGLKIGIGQIEVVNLAVFDEVKEAYKKAILDIKQDKGLDWAMLMITDIIKGDSLLLTSGYQPAERLLSYKNVDENIYYLTNILSRKKQLLPEIFRVLEELLK